MTERALLEDTGHGFVPQTPGWFVVNLADAQWLRSEKFGLRTKFDGGYVFQQLGINVRVLQPGQPNCYYHAEDQQEDFLVLSGECRLLVEGEEISLKAHDYFHCPPLTEHVFVGAGDAPCVILMIGLRSPDIEIRYPVSELAQRHGAGVDEETTEPAEAYANVPPWQISPESGWPVDS